MGSQGHKEVSTMKSICWLNEMRMKYCCEVTCLLICSRFIKGFMTRNNPACIDNSEYLAYVRQNYLTRLKQSLPKTVLEKEAWPTPPPIMKEVGDTSFNC